MSCRTGRCKTVLFVFALLAMTVLTVPALGQPGVTTENCIQNEWNLAQGKSVTCTSSSCTLGCTANDVSIAAVVNTRDVTGAQVAQCQGGNTFNFIADFEIKTTSKSSRSNIGLYIAETGTTVADALSVTNTCADNIIPPPTGFVNNNTDGKHPTIGANGHFLCSGSSTVSCGTDYYDELDQATVKPADNCGDTSSTDKGGFGTGTQKVTLEINGFKCPDPNDPNLPTCTVNINGVPVTGKCAVLPNCTSWQVPGQTTFCESTPGQQGYPYNAGVPEAVPGTTSKCNCGVITLPIIAQKGNVVVQKMCQTPTTNGAFTFDPGNPSGIPPTRPTESPTSCDSGVEGSDTVTYEVAVTNQSNFGSLSLTTLNDDVYGDITKVQGGVISTTCNNLPQSIALNASYTCTFTAKNAGTSSADAPTVTDIVSATLTDQSNKTVGPTTSNSVTVTPDEAPSAATVNKGLGSPSLTAGCATANFKVDVKNTTNPGYDESETLTGLSDSKYGNPTTITGSTCSLPQTLAPGASYSCQFSGQFCGDLQTVDQLGTGTCNAVTGACTAGALKSGLQSCTKNSDCNLTCLGLTETDVITATIQGDEFVAGTCNTTTGFCSAGQSSTTSCTKNSDCDLGDAITPTGNNMLTVDVCLTPTAQASH